MTVAATALIWLGVMGLSEGDFVPVWQPVPQWVPAREVLAYLCAWISLASGIGLLWWRSHTAACRGAPWGSASRRTVMPSASEAPIVLADNDPARPAPFERARVRLAFAIREWLAGPIEHIGSTAEPGLPAKHWFCAPSPAQRTHHLHLVPINSPLWVDRLAFRDHLRRHPSVATEYAALKADLAHRFRMDREAYTDAKAPFVARVLGGTQQSRNP